MKTKLFLSLALATLVFGGNIFAASKNKVTLEEAQAIALKRANGEVIQANTIDKKNKTLYSFFIKEPSGLTTHIVVNEKGKIKSFVDETPETAKVK